MEFSTGLTQRLIHCLQKFWHSEEKHCYSFKVGLISKIPYFQSQKVLRSLGDWTTIHSYFKVNHEILTKFRKEPKSKVPIFWEGHKQYLLTSNKSGGFIKRLGRSQNIFTLIKSWIENSTMCISSSQFYFVVAKTNNLYLHEMRVVVQLSKPASLLARPLSVFPK